MTPLEMTGLKSAKLVKEFERDLSDVFEEGKSMQTMAPIVKRVLRKKASEWLIAAGKTEGKAEGMAEGRAEGMVEGKRETARLMLARDMEIDVIADLTGLSVEEINALRA